MDDAADVAQKVREADAGRDDWRVLGPAPAPLGRLRGEYRGRRNDVSSGHGGYQRQQGHQAPGPGPGRAPGPREGM